MCNKNTNITTTGGGEKEGGVLSKERDRFLQVKPNALFWQNCAEPEKNATGGKGPKKKDLVSCLAIILKASVRR